MRNWSRLACMIGMVLMGQSLTAQETEGKKKERNRLVLKKEVVVATRNEKTIVDLPYTTWSIGSEEMILEDQARSLPEALDVVPGVMLQKTGHGMTSPYLRGVTSQRVVLFADAVRLNNSYLREGPNQYWNLVDHYFYNDVEVLMGPGAVLYGSDAIGGVVHAKSNTSDRGEDGGGCQWLGGIGIVRGATAERSYSEHLRTDFALDDDFTISLGLTRQDFGELQTGDHTSNPDTNYEQWSANLRVRQWLDDSSSILYGYDRFDQDDVDRVHRTIYHVDFEGTSTKGGTSDLQRTYDHDREVAFARYELRDGDPALEELDFGVSYQNFMEHYHRIRNDYRQQRRFTRVETLGFNLRAQSGTGLGTLSYGVDFYHDDVNSSGQDISATGDVTERPQGLVADDARYELTGVYTQLESELSSRISTIAGVRYTYADMDAGVVNFGGGNVDSLRGNWDAVTGSGRVMYQAMDKDQLNLFAGISQGFRAPNLSDATRDGEFGGGTEAPTANLDAERFLTYEVGSKSVGDWGFLGMTYYYTQIEDRIARLSTPTTKRNLEEGYIQGAEVALNWRFVDNFMFRGQVAWQEGEERNYLDRTLANPTVDRPMSRMAPLGGTVALRWQEPESPVWVEVGMDWAKSQDRVTEAEENDNRFPPEGTPSYEVFHIRSGWDINDNWSVSLAVENITDEEYRIHGSGVNEPGRNFIGTIAYQF